MINNIWEIIIWATIGGCIGAAIGNLGYMLFLVLYDKWQEHKRRKERVLWNQEAERNRLI